MPLVYGPVVRVGTPRIQGEGEPQNQQLWGALKQLWLQLPPQHSCAAAART